MSSINQQQQREAGETRRDLQLYQEMNESVEPRRNVAPAPAPPPPWLVEQRRGLCEGAENHCFTPKEKNVFSPPTEPRFFTEAPSPAPSISPQPTSFRADRPGCESDEQGNYGDTDSPSSHVVSYRYQVETTPEISSAVTLDVEVLQDIEKAISDLMVQKFFADQCSSPQATIDVAIPSNSNVKLQQLFVPATEMAKRAADLEEEKTNNHGTRKLLGRKMKTETHEAVLGLSAEPIDQVLEGDDGEACPFPTTTGPCFVVGGGLTMYGDNSDATSSGGLLWVDEGVHEELQRAMNSGELDNYHPEVVAIRYIPPGTELPSVSPPPTNPNSGTEDDSISGRTSAISFVLVGLGFFLVVGVFTYLFISRRREREQEERNTSLQIGAFPIVVSHFQDKDAPAHNNAPIDPNSRASKTYAEISQYYSTTPDFLMSTGNQSDSESDDEEGVALHVFHDDENSPRLNRFSTSWRDQILGNDPILNDEQDRHGISSPTIGYKSSAESTQFHSVGSWEDGTNSDYLSPRSGSPRRLSPSKNDSPSKLTVAFGRGEML